MSVTRKDFDYFAFWYGHLYADKKTKVQTWSNRPYLFGNRHATRWEKEVSLETFLEIDPNDPTNITAKDSSYIADVIAYERKGTLGKLWQRWTSFPTIETKQKVVRYIESTKQFHEKAKLLSDQQKEELTLRGDIFYRIGEEKRAKGGVFTRRDFLERMSPKSVHKAGLFDHYPWEYISKPKITFRDRLEKWLGGKGAIFWTHAYKHEYRDTFGLDGKFLEVVEYFSKNVYKNDIEALKMIYNNPLLSIQEVQEQELALKKARYTKIIQYVHHVALNHSSMEHTVESLQETDFAIEQNLWGDWEKLLDKWKTNNIAFSPLFCNAAAARILPSSKSNSTGLPESQIKDTSRGEIMAKIYERCGRFSSNQTKAQQKNIMYHYIYAIKDLLDETFKTIEAESKNYSRKHYGGSLSSNFYVSNFALGSPELQNRLAEHQTHITHIVKAGIMILHPDKHSGLILSNDDIAPMNKERQRLQDELPSLQKKVIECSQKHASAKKVQDPARFKKEHEWLKDILADAPVEQDSLLRVHKYKGSPSRF